MKAYLKYIFMVSFLALAMTACYDDPIYVDSGEIPNGETTVTLEASFNHFTESKLSRAEENTGNILDNIKSLWVIIYDKNGDISGTPKNVWNGTSQTVNNITLEKLSFGEYYIVGVANPKDDFAAKLGRADESIKTLHKLRSFRVTWDDENIEKNGEMLCCFQESSEAVAASELSDQFSTVTINRPGMKLKGRLRRCASKITINFDGSALREGVEVYIKEARILDIAYDCSLSSGDVMEGEGKYDNVVSKEEEETEGMIGRSNQVISYSRGTNVNKDETIVQAESTKPNYQNWPKISCEQGSQTLGDKIHDDTSNALYFYENLQDYKGDLENPKKPILDYNSGGTKYVTKDAVPYGTYIEVEGYYKSTAIGNNNEGKIRYRFMLGMDVVKDFHAFRNIHYKLTLILKGNGNEADWHMEYDEQVLEVTQPQIVNYQGRYFVPKQGIYANYPNLGHYFTNENYIEISSYMNYYETDGVTTTKKQTPLDYKIQYFVEGKDGTPGEYVDDLPDDFMLLIDDSEIVENTQGLVRKQKFRVKPRTPNSINIWENIGTRSGTYNLASATGDGNGIDNTANCYIVDCTGTYTLPLVYGNAITDGETNLSSYKFTRAYVETDTILPYLKNYLNENISSPYIKEDTHKTPKAADVVWQDYSGLVTNVKYDSNLYSCGGLQFDVSQKHEGNAVIAIYEDTEKTRVMWSWHIWVTSFKGFEEVVKVNRSGNAIGWPAVTEFNLMSVNLGWCSEGDPILYYPERKCKIRIISGNAEREVEVEQKSHMAFPRGSNTYYQWGRKDPFWGVKNGVKKPIYPDVPDKDGNPKRFYQSLYDGADNTKPVEECERKRRTTVKLFTNDGSPTVKDQYTSDEYYFDYSTGNRLIQQPDKWHNPPRFNAKGNLSAEDKESVHAFDSRNETFYNLWGQQYTNYGSGWQYSTVKTVYDPCPVGYMVPHYNAFSPFTVGGLNDWCGTGNDTGDTFESENWYEAAIPNIDWNGAKPLNNAWVAPYTKNLFEFYTDITKLQSIIFPENGYRDWDDDAKITAYADGSANGYSWTKAIEEGVIFKTVAKKEDWGTRWYFPSDAAYNFEFSRSEQKVRPGNEFNTCDGMPIRPVVIE